MKALLKLNVLLLLCAMTFGCAHKQKEADPDSATALNSQESVAYTDVSKHRKERFRELLPTAMERKDNAKLMRTAHSALGTPYVRGGTDPSGFDCSGFVKWTYKSVGVNLPRTAREQSVIGQRINRVEDMVAGDIVTFRHPKRGYHTGIYVGDGKFIHSPRKRTRVRINDLNDAYFSSTFTGARRVSLTGGENLVAQAESRLVAEAPAKVGKSSSSSKKVKQSKGKSKSRMIASVSGKSKGKAAGVKSSAEKSSGKAKLAKQNKSSRTATAQASRSGKGKHSAERGKRVKAKTSASNDSKKSSRTSAKRG